MANLKFRYTHENPYNETMEGILENYDFEELEDDDEKVVYIKNVTNVDYFYDIFKPYFEKEYDYEDIESFDIMPSSTYGWGFDEDVLVVINGYEDELGEFAIPTKYFINIF